jgi:tryptophan synthase alpha chain
MHMNRIEEKMAQLQENHQKAFIPYITAGLPDLARTGEILKALERGGCDVVELGIPFSDPVADGPVIQDASYRSILGGTNLKKVFTLVEQLRADGLKLPIIFMMYYNTILHYGIEAFVETCEKVGVDGLIIPDLPLEEQDELRQALAKTDATILLQLVSPVSGARIPKIVDGARGFIYCVSSMGVTGQEADFHAKVLDYLKSVKDAASIPVMMGFGIRTAADVAPMHDIIDGAIVGSYFIRLMEEHDFDPQIAEDSCKTFKTELNQH